MAELAKKLYFKKDGVEQTAKAYSTTAEAGTDYIENKIDGVTAYVAIGDTADGRATIGLIKKSSTAVDRTILSSGKLPYNKVEYRTPGTYTFTSPATTLRVTIAGAGGGGGGGGGFIPLYNGGNGGRGGSIIQNINVTPNNTITVKVGAGGSGGQSQPYASNRTDGSDGEGSSVGSIIAAGGGGGKKATNSANGAAGTSYGDGGDGGAGGSGSANGSAGSPGWVIIEYGGDI